MKKIILIDDKPDMQSALSEALKPFLNSEYEIEPWLTETALSNYECYIDKLNNESNADEDVWFRYFNSRNDIAIVVADHDLSSYQGVRISESSIADACRQSSTPICTYHRAPSTKTAGQSLRGIYGQTKSFSITLEMSGGEEASAARQIISLANGFKIITEKFASTDKEIKKLGPPAILASILDRPGLTNTFALYASGPSLASDAIYHIAQSNKQRDSVTEDLNERLPFILGCWLSNYILPFPGVILNSKAAASYINIDTKHFITNSDRFESARYRGPFSDNECYWWRTDLEQILIDSDVEDGIAYLEQFGIRAEPSVCIATKSSPAGYYCIVQKEPISLGASIGNLGWIPQGAVLSRIDQTIYDSVAHMMGI